MILLLVLLATEPETITVSVRRNVPASQTLVEQTDLVLPLKHTGCDGLARLGSLSYTLSVGQKDQDIIVSMPVEPVIEKLVKGPLFPPTLVIHQRDAPPLKFVFETSMASSRWESGGTFRDTFHDESLADANFWTSVELVCSAESPYRAALIPEHVTYKRGGDAEIAAAVAKLRSGLRTEHGFGNASMYGEIAMVGADLYAKLKDDPSLAKVKTPKTVMVDPSTGKERNLMRLRGEEELAIFGAVMRRYLGFAPLRIRAATSSELAAHWLNIGWDIEEPILVADYGTHRFIIDFNEGSPWMIDELP